MNKVTEENLLMANKVVSEILKGSNVESYGVMNQTLFIDFRDNLGEDSRLYIHSGLNIDGFIRSNNLSEVEYSLICMSKINLLEVLHVECRNNLGLTITFADNISVNVDNVSENPDEDPWQLNSSMPISDGGNSIIALANDGYAIW